MKRLACFFAGLLLIFLVECRGDGAWLNSPSVRLGSDVLLADSIHLVEGKRLGVVCNRASRLSDGRFIVDALFEKGLAVVVVFSPEHGLDITASAGESVASSRYEGLMIHSLYGKTKKPTSAMLRGIDVLVFDLQDVGARYYTYISTMGLCMESASERGIPFIVLDRPNPVTGTRVEGPVLDMRHASFVGMYPIPVRHGMTVGELAGMIVAKHWVHLPRSLRLHVIPMHGWKRSCWFDQTGLEWVSPSPNIPDSHTALVYLGTCLIEATDLSEGRGTDQPFLVIGAPNLDTESIISELNGLDLPGVAFTLMDFVPQEKVGVRRPKYMGMACRGIGITVLDRDIFQPVTTGVMILRVTLKHRPSTVIKGTMKSLLGIHEPERIFRSGESMRTLAGQWEVECRNFLIDRKPFMMYED